MQRFKHLDSRDKNNTLFARTDIRWEMVLYVKVPARTYVYTRGMDKRFPEMIRVNVIFELSNFIQ